MKAELWFYRGPGRLVDKIIRWWTDSPYSHCEIVIGNLAYGASGWDNEFRVTDATKFNPDNWVKVLVESFRGTEWLNAQLGKKYDYLGIFGFLFFKVEDPKRWYCSEVAAAFLNIKLRPITPQDLLEAILFGNPISR